jgi:hypothetical protein
MPSQKWAPVLRPDRRQNKDLEQEDEPMISRRASDPAKAGNERKSGAGKSLEYKSPEKRADYIARSAAFHGLANLAVLFANPGNQKAGTPIDRLFGQARGS